MKAIKVLLSIIILLALLIFLVIPPVIGLWAKHEFSNTLSTLNRSYPSLTTSITDYQFGWFRSTIDARFDVHLKNGAVKHEFGNNNMRFMTHLIIRQGPIIIRKQQKHYNRYLALADIDLQSPELQLRAHSIWHLSLWASVQFSATKFRIITSLLNINGQNLQGMLTFHLGKPGYKTHTTMESLKVSTFNQTTTPTISINQIMYNADIQKSSFINIGHQTFTTKKLTVNIDPNNPITLSGISATSNTQLRHEKINMMSNYDIQSITQNKFGISGLQLNFSIKNVDENHFNQLLKMLAKNKKMQPSSYQSFVTPGLALLKKGLSIDINQLTLRTQDGNVSLVGAINVPKLPDNITLLAIPMMIKADFYFQSPRTWLIQQMTAFYTYLQSKQSNPSSIDPQQMAENTLEKWQQQQLITDSGNQLKTRIQFQDGFLRFNGKPMVQQPPLRIQTPQ